MQFSVPQFTDVQDRIVANLTIKQFGIIFGAGALIFAVFAVSKSAIATIIIGLLVGLPALVVSFGRVNGRPIYMSFGPLATFLTGNKTYVFHKEAKTLLPDQLENATIEQTDALAVTDPGATRVKLQELNYVLQQQASQQGKLLERIQKSDINTKK